jgi:hypothetical protein
VYIQLHRPGESLCIFSYDTMKSFTRRPDTITLNFFSCTWTPFRTWCRARLSSLPAEVRGRGGGVGREWRVCRCMCASICMWCGGVRARVNEQVCGCACGKGGREVGTCAPPRPLSSLLPPFVPIPPPPPLPLVSPPPPSPPPSHLSPTPLPYLENFNITIRCVDFMAVAKAPSTGNNPMASASMAQGIEDYEVKAQASITAFQTTGAISCTSRERRQRREQRAFLIQTRCVSLPCVMCTACCA